MIETTLFDSRKKNKLNKDAKINARTDCSTLTQMFAPRQLTLFAKMLF